MALAASSLRRSLRHLHVPYQFAQQGTILRKTGRPRPTGVAFGSEKDRKQIDDKVALAGVIGMLSQRVDHAKPITLGPIQLYDIQHDFYETTDLFEKHPEVVEELTPFFPKAVSDGRTRP